MAGGPHAVTSMADVALVSLEPASAALSGTKVMARALDALARANVEVLAFTSSSYRQNFCFLVRQSELDGARIEHLEEALALELAHGYVKPFEVDTNVGLLAVVGEGMQGTPGLAARIFTAISRAQGQHHRHRAGIERADHRRRGAPRRAGAGGARRARRMRPGSVRLACLLFFVGPDRVVLIEGLPQQRLDHRLPAHVQPRCAGIELA